MEQLSESDREWVGTSRRPVRPRTRVVVGLALAASAVLVGVRIAQVAQAAQPSPTDPAPVMRSYPDRSPGHEPTAGIRIPANEPLVDHCAQLDPRASRERCFELAQIHTP